MFLHDYEMHNLVQNLALRFIYHLYYNQISWVAISDFRFVFTLYNFLQDLAQFLAIGHHTDHQRALYLQECQVRLQKFNYKQVVFKETVYSSPCGNTHEMDNH